MHRIFYSAIYSVDYFGKIRQKNSKYSRFIS